MALRLPLSQGRPLHELHHDEESLSRDAEVEHPDDVRIVEAGHRSRLTTHPLVPVDVDAIDELDRDVAVELGVPRPVHDPHGAPAELLGQLVPAGTRIGGALDALGGQRGEVNHPLPTLGTSVQVTDDASTL